MRPWPVLLLLTAPAALVANCALEQFDNRPATTTTPPTTTTTSSGGGGGAGGGECDHESFPGVPDAGTEGGTDAGELDFVLALRRIWNEDDAGTFVGYDLDNTCTCQGQESSCRPPVPGSDCDEPRGIDNNFALIFAPLELATQQPDLLAYYSDRANAGEWSLLMRVRDYNGEADDRQVELAWYVTHGVMAAPPGWTGQDGWRISAHSVGTGADGGLDVDVPVFVDEHAYVVDHTLVASLPNADLTLGGGTNRLVFRVTAGGVVARISDESGIWRATVGRIFGRLALPDMFYAISTYRDSSGAAICTDNFGYAALRDGLCSMPDILTELGTPSDPCDAVSVGMGFEAVEARLGVVEPAVELDGGCPEGLDPADDSCTPW